MKQKFLLVASLAVGLLAAVLAHAWLNAKNAEVEQLKADIRSRQQTVVILAAARALPRGATLKEGDLIPVRTLRAVTSSDNLGDGDQAFAYGRRLNHPVDPDDPILWSYLEGGRDSSRRLGEDVPTGKRAVSIPVSGASAVSGLVRPEDHVDVLGSFAMPAAEGGHGTGEDAEMVTLTDLQNVTVLAVGTETARSRGGSRGGSSAGYGTVTLLVTPREAEVLVFAQQMRGRLFLSLRNPGDVNAEEELPTVDFSRIREELSALNELRQREIRRSSSSYPRR